MGFDLPDGASALILYGDGTVETVLDTAFKDDDDASDEMTLIAAIGWKLRFDGYWQETLVTDFLRSLGESEQVEWN